jgi:hypothetical protein
MESPVPIWRRLLIDPEMSLELVHEVFQIAMGWWDYHLYEFRLGKRKFGDLLDADGDKTVEDSSEFSLSDLLKKPGDKLLYAYDFGDDWMHEVTLERRAARGPSKYVDEDEDRWAKCLHGKRACPPEDCFGVTGYADLLDAIEDPLHQGRKDKLDWMGCDFDPDSFDPRIVNLRLFHWENEIKEEYLIFAALQEESKKENNLVALVPPNQKPKQKPKKPD